MEQVLTPPAQFTGFVHSVHFIMGSSDAQELKYLSGQKPSSPLTAWGPAALSGQSHRASGDAQGVLWVWNQLGLTLAEVLLEPSQIVGGKSKCLLTYGFVKGAMMCKTTQKTGSVGFGGG